tara:strand:+ start:620 stop:2506 length:1887 start_codon:yes stop_codon:yes gene_type:complete
MAKQKLSWQLLIKKLIIRTIVLLIFWGIGSNFVYLAGRSKPNKYNNFTDAYNPGWFDFPFHKDYMPYSNRDPLNSNLEDPAKQKFKEFHEKLHQEEANQTGGGSKWTSYLEKTFNKMSSMSRKRSNKRKNRSRKIQKGGNPNVTPTTQESQIPQETGMNPIVKDMEDEVSTAGKFLGLDLNKQEEIIKKVYEDFENYYGKGKYGGETIDGDTVDSEGRKVEKLGVLGKLYLNFDLTSNKYGFPYNFQQDGRKYVLADGTVKTNSVYNDGSLFSDDPNYNPSSMAKNIMGEVKLKKSSVNTPKTTAASKTATTANLPVNVTPTVEQTKDTKSMPSVNNNTNNINNANNTTKTTEQKGGNPNQKRKPEPTLIEQLSYFLTGGWTKLFTQGAPDFFGWVQEKSWCWHRMFLNKLLGFISTFYSDKPSGLMWIYVAALIHFAPIFLTSFYPIIYPWISGIQTFIHHYLYSFRDGNNHLLTGWLWSGNFLFIPQILTALTCWIPILNIIVAAICLLCSFFPSILTIAVTGITTALQTFRSFFYLTIGHLFTPNGSQFWKGNMFGEYRYRGLFIMELAILIALTIQTYLPYDESVRNGASIGVIGSWLLFQIIVWMRGNSGWKGFWKDPAHNKN